MQQYTKAKITKWMFISLAIIVLGITVAACSAPASPAPTPSATAVEMDMESTGDEAETGGMEMDMEDAPSVPAGLAYAEGEEIRFIHTEVSDPEIGKLLSDMMDSPVLVVPALAKAPEEMLAKVYVFTNGVQGMGPLGFQPDVFDNPPGAQGYSPLRIIILVTWADESKAREVKSAADVAEAESAGDVTLEQPGVVVNMPFITWPGGER